MVQKRIRNLLRILMPITLDRFHQISFWSIIKLFLKRLIRAVFFSTPPMVAAAVQSPLKILLTLTSFSEILIILFRIMVVSCSARNLPLKDLNFVSIVSFFFTEADTVHPNATDRGLSEEIDLYLRNMYF